MAVDNREMIVLNGEQIDELVRCKDCKWYREVQGFCVFGRWDLSPNDYCSFAERKEVEEWKK